MGERCKLPQRVWGGAPAANDFGAFWTKMEASGAIIPIQWSSQEAEVGGGQNRKSPPLPSPLFPSPLLPFPPLPSPHFPSLPLPFPLPSLPPPANS